MFHTDMVIITSTFAILAFRYLRYKKKHDNKPIPILSPISPYYGPISLTHHPLDEYHDDDDIIYIGEHITLQDVEDVIYGNKKVAISPRKIPEITASRAFLEQCIDSGGTYYGLNTGFGLLSSVRIERDDIETLQYNLLRSHAVGMGKPMSDDVVRAMLVLRAQNLAIGYSGVRLELVQHVVNILNAGIIPLVPEYGSVGASGDLAPLAHLSLVFIGEGEAKYHGKVMTGKEALKEAGIEPIKLHAKEGLALINGTQFMTAIGVVALHKADWLSSLADVCGAMSLESVRGTTAAFEPQIHQVRPHPGQVRVAKNIRSILLNDANGKLVKSEIAQSHENCSKVQDPYSFRCIPQVHGACQDVIDFSRSVFEREINSVTDNPLVFAETKCILSGGNFHGEINAFALDFLAIALAELGSISEQRFEKLINPHLSDLPAFLIRNGGLNSGFMMHQVTAAALVSANKTLCHPASVDSIATSVDKEDHVSMGAWAGIKCLQVLDNVQRVLLLELLAGCQAIDLLRPLRTSYHLEAIHAMVRARVQMVDNDRSFQDDFRNLEMLFDEKFFQDFIRASPNPYDFKDQKAKTRATSTTRASIAHSRYSIASSSTLYSI